MDTPASLAKAVDDYSIEVQRLAKVVANYAVDVGKKETLYKRALGAAVAGLKLEGMAPSLAKMAAENEQSVKDAQDALDEANTLYTIGKAEFDGVTARFQAAKKRAELMREEVRAFRG